MDKLKLAHEYAMQYMQSKFHLETKEELIALSWGYADAMQAESDKRKPSGLPDALKEEWQPDWSKAPGWAKWWAMDGFSNKANWYKTEPFLDDDDSDEWNIVLNSSDTYKGAPSFKYQGNWQESLRERPHGF